MRDSSRNHRLEDPANLGAPMQPYLSPGARWYVSGRWSRFGKESGWMIILSLIGGVIGFFVLMFLGNVLNAWVW